MCPTVLLHLCFFTTASTAGTVGGTVIDKFPVHYENGTLYHVLVAKNDGSREIFSISPSIYGLSSTALQEQVVVGRKYTFRVAGFNLADLIFRNIVSVTPSQY